MTDLQAQAKELADRLELIVFGNVSTLHTLLLARQLLRRIERGELVEVVRCGECKWRNTEKCSAFSHYDIDSTQNVVMKFHFAGNGGDDDFCSQGRRKSDANG